MNFLNMNFFKPNPALQHSPQLCSNLGMWVYLQMQINFYSILCQGCSALLGLIRWLTAAAKDLSKVNSALTLHYVFFRPPCSCTATTPDLDWMSLYSLFFGRSHLFKNVCLLAPRRTGLISTFFVCLHLKRLLENSVKHKLVCIFFLDDIAHNSLLMTSCKVRCSAFNTYAKCWYYL